MASKVWTQEQRERAADDFSGAMIWTQNRTVKIVLPCGDRIHITEAELNTQCSLNHLQDQLNEARELLENEPKDISQNRIEWQSKRRAWLSRNK